jgi:aldehyde dehydrogenase (NAD+)
LHNAEKDELARLDAISMGKPISTHGIDVTYASTQYNYFAEAAYPQGHTSLNTPGFLNMSLRQPFGVVAVIIPWNAPLIFFAKKVAPALAAGNCVVVKSSEKAPLTVSLAEDVLDATADLLAVVESSSMD